MGRIVVRDVRLFDGVGPGVSAGATVAWEGDRITEVTTGGTAVPTRPDDVVVEGNGRTVMPAMVMTHLHSTYSDLGAVKAPFGLDHPVPYQAIRAAKNVERLVGCGYTSAVSAGAAHDVDASLQQAISEGLIPGPRLIPCSRELSTTGHSNDGSPWWWGTTALGATRLCDSPDAFRLAVREEIKRGARMIKVYLTGGHGVASPAEQMEMTRDELVAVVDTAHARGARVRAHIANKAAILLALEVGVDIIDHADGMDAECVAAIVEAGAFVVPSLFFLETVMANLPPEAADTAQRMRASLEAAYEALHLAADAGVRLTVGDDYGALGFAHGMYNHELVSLVKRAGIAPDEVLRWATRNGAAMMLMEDDLGAVEVGRLADVLLVDGDPVADIAVLAEPANLVAVIKEGVTVAGALPGH
jgi:imidazolonepropionase-like amidohydrolase